MAITQTTNDSSDPKISELDFTFNEFRQQKVLTNESAYVQMIARLLTMRPGDYPTLPGMGINIGSYRFADMDNLVAGELQDKIQNQITQYISGVPLNEVNISMTRVPKIGYALFVDIVLWGESQRVTYAYLQKQYKIISSNISIEKPSLINTNGQGG